MSTHNIGFYEELSKISLNIIIIKYHQIRTLFLLLDSEHLPSLIKGYNVFVVLSCQSLSLL